VTVTQEPDLVTPKLPALLEYQLSLRTPHAPKDSFDHAAAGRGRALFEGEARCTSCHVPPNFTDVLSGPTRDVPLLHDAAEVGMDPTYAQRSATGKYRTEPLRALWWHSAYFHDGSAKDLSAVVDHYDSLFSLGLSASQKADLVEFLKSL
jgi:cytochrome c peroxidase